MQPRRQHTSEQAMELLQQKRDAEEQRKIDLGKKELIKYRFKQSLMQPPQESEIFPLIKIALPEFISACIRPNSRKEFFQDMRADALGEVESEGLSNMRKDKQLNAVMTASLNLRKTLDRQRLTKASNPSDLFAQVDNIVEIQMKNDTKNNEKPHVPLNKIPHLLREFSGDRSNSAKTSMDAQNSRRSTQQIVDPLKMLIRNRKSGLSRELNRNIKIPTLEEVERRKKSVITPQRVQTPSGLRLNTMSSMRPSMRRSTALLTSSNKEKFTVEGIDQLYNAADNLANAYIQNSEAGTNLLEKYKLGFSSRKRKATPTIQSANQKLASSQKLMQDLATNTRKLSNTVRQGIGNMLNWINQ